MLQFVDSQGYTWYINHLISFIVLTTTFVWACKQQWTGQKDKFVHYMVSAAMTIVFIWICLFIKIPWWIAPIAALLVGAGKEVYDYFHPKTHKCDILDFRADFLGVLAITTLYFCSWIM
jgi:hypothetical protein